MTINCKYLLFFMIGLCGSLLQLTNGIHTNSACGVRPLNQREPRRQHVNSRNNNHLLNDNVGDVGNLSRMLTRNPKIISGAITKENDFPWQVSLELLHPSLGFLGHWCGAVLINQYWIISAAHCVHNDLFNLPIPELWTAVLGEYDRNVETGDEQRISIEKIVMHENYHNFQNDLVLMKLSRPANISPSSRIRQICLPFMNIQETNIQTNPIDASYDDDFDELNDFSDLTKDDNFLRNMKWKRNINYNENVNDNENKIKLNIKEILINSFIKNIKTLNRKNSKKLIQRRRNDKFFQEKNTFKRITASDSQQQNANNFMRKNTINDNSFKIKEITYLECIATGWGQSKLNGNLTNVLLKAKVPIHNNSRCDVTYGSFVKLHKGHLCAGRLDGLGGTCVGDSGGPLQCRLSLTSPWILVGVTSFGSGCALKGYPDVYTRISYYMKWITETISKSDSFYDDR